VLACPGSREEEKGYLEPGGSFSPAPGSYGLSFWISDAGGQIAATGDDIPLSAIAQRFLVESAADYWQPRIETRTPYYQATWRADCGGRYSLSLGFTERAKDRAVVVVRSVGPAGGPIQTLQWHADTLTINDRWRVRFSPAPAHVRLGQEATSGGDPSWRGERFSALKVSSSSGWAFARLAWQGTPTLSVTLEDSWPVRDSPLRSSAGDVPIVLSGVDASFRSSLEAQIAHLTMSLVGAETRPGEPTNYPLPWLRDGAYVIVGLVRAGFHDLALKLVEQLVENDFFGGFGPEGDGPGLALWAITEVSEHRADPVLDARLWPHVYRKAELIGRMLTSGVAVRQEPTSNLVPEHRSRSDMDLVADPARNDLIFGRMDFRRPALSISALSYLGLQGAIRHAQLMGDRTAAARWRSWSDRLRKGWRNGIGTDLANEERTYVSGLHPSWMAIEDLGAYRRGLQRVWNETRTSDGEFKRPPLWSYFEAARAHQWLLAGEPATAWNTLAWFHRHQVAVGLYTWSEGNGEENSFHRWSQIRGWLKPSHVTPHYWTAAEILLLQLAMLAYEEPRNEGEAPTWVLGAGVQESWLKGSVHVQGVGTMTGQVDWEWKEGTVSASIRGDKGRVKLGRAFPPGTKLITKFERTSELAEP
jgi:hypothetical protein